MKTTNSVYNLCDTEEGIDGNISVKSKKKYDLIKRIAFASFKLGCLLCFLLFVILPLVYKFSYKIQQSVVFLNFVSIPKNPDYGNPARYEIQGVRNFYLQTDDNMMLGVWQILSDGVANDTSEFENPEFYERALRNGDNVILYNHGNSGHRVASHRIELYKVLRKRFHVIAYDYRGYGDSSDVNPTEKGLVKDCIFMYKWLKNKTSGKIFVWGHSLGTGLSTHMIAILGKEGIVPSGLILESPFTSMREEISEHPLAQIFKPLPWFHYTVVEPMQVNNFTFASDRHIMNVDCSILILHAEDDRVVPYKLGYKLYQLASEYRKPSQGTIKFIGFPKKLSYGHKYICRDPELLNFLKDFESSALNEAEEKKL
nr:monoacylglycerol lipase ABHD12-like isoform X1 [Onthophagus taurus]